MWGGDRAYEFYCGRWSQLVAADFVAWLEAPTQAAWLDVGCGTGRLTRTIARMADPKVICGVDPAEGFISFARTQITSDRVAFLVGEAMHLPVADLSYDAVVSGLVLNFIPDLTAGIGEMVRVSRSGGLIGAYVWDYASRMETIRYFWDAAVELDQRAMALDEGRSFPICQPDPLVGLFAAAGLSKVEVRPIDITTRFVDFDDYWSPFLGGQGPAPRYVLSLPAQQQEALRELLRSRLPIAADGSITLVARAWAIRSKKENRQQ